MNWKPPSITTRTAEYLRKIGHLSDADKLEYFDNIVGAAFRKGYNVRKGDELKMRGEKVHNARVKAAAKQSGLNELLGMTREDNDGLGQ